MAATSEVTLLTGRDAHHIGINGEVKTIADVLASVGITGDVTVRVNSELVTDHSRELRGGETITAFRTETVARAGVKGAHKS